MSDEQYGKPIAEEDAHRMFALYYDIKKRSVPKIQAALAGDDEALRYYCGRPGKDPLAEDWGFVFSRDFLQDLLQKAESQGADCLFVFYGAKRLADLGPEEQQDTTERDGRPTLLLIPAVYHEVTNPTDNEFTLLRGDGGQYPGTGGDTIPDGAPVRLPAGFTKGKYH